MPCLNKEAISKQFSTNCRRQLFYYLYPDTAAFSGERQAHNIPPTQAPRPGLEQFIQEGERWQREKTAELARYLGADALIGGWNHQTANLGTVSLLDVLPGSQHGQFIAEAVFQPPPAFLQLFGLLGFQDRHGFEMRVSSFRPDLLAVQAPLAGSLIVGLDGNVHSQTDERIRLRVIDIKLSSEPSPGYFAETVLYSIALAQWLAVVGMDAQFCVSAEPAVWPGSHEGSQFATAGEGEVAPSPDELHVALEADLEVAPFEVFAARIRQILTHDIPNVLLSEDWRTLDAHVDNRCRSCEYIGYPWTSRDPNSARNPHTNHCLPQATTTGHLSRIAFISRGGASALRLAGVPAVDGVADLTPAHPTFDSHHGLRQTRHMIANRALSLASNTTIAVEALATLATLPAFVDRRVFITVDFETSSAITFAIGLMVVPAVPAIRGFEYRGGDAAFGRKFYIVPTKSIDAERAIFIQFLRDLSAMLEGPINNNPAKYQVYLWDELQYGHLCDLAGRHLAGILEEGSIAHLAWLFPSDEILGNPDAQGVVSPISILKNSVRSLLAVPVPHYYTLLGTARCYHYAALPENLRNFHVHPLFEDPLSDMIPSERAHDIWSRSPEMAMTIQRLNETIDTRLRAMFAIVRRLGEDLRGRLTCQAPAYRSLSPRDSLTGSVSVDSH